MSSLNSKKIKRGNQLSFFQFDLFNQYKDINHLITTRLGGISKGSLESLNLSYKVGDNPGNVKQNRILLSKEIESPVNLVIPCQMHTNNIAVVNEYSNDADLQDTDGIITGTKNLAIGVLIADCVPVFLYDPVNKVTAVLHAGWRGTVGKIVSKAIIMMHKQFDTDPKQLIAGIGPSISPEVYEIGLEVKHKAEEQLGKGHGVIVEKNGKIFFDLWKANLLQCTENGIPEKNIEVAGICTFQHQDLFYSARGSREITGRFAAVIMLK